MRTLKNLGSVQKKVLLLLGAGMSLGLARTPAHQFRILRSARKEWQNINKANAERAIKSLYTSKLIDLRVGQDGNWRMILNEAGRKRLLLYNLESMRISKPKRWDKKWRVIIFDIPERQKAARDAFRRWMKRIGFYKLQASVFISPYECRDEYNFMVEFLDLRKYARFLVIQDIDNELHLKKVFSLK